MDWLFHLSPLLLILIPTYLATFYLWRLYLSDETVPRSWLAWTICMAATLKAVAGSWLAFAYVYRLQNDGNAPDEWRIVTGAAIAALILAPVAYAIQFERRRRAARRRLKEAPHAPQSRSFPEATD
jgi:hypothetical protein